MFSFSSINYLIANRKNLFYCSIKLLKTFRLTRKYFFLESAFQATCFTDETSDIILEKEYRK